MAHTPIYQYPFSQQAAAQQAASQQKRDSSPYRIQQQQQQQQQQQHARDSSSSNEAPYQRSASPFGNKQPSNLLANHSNHQPALSQQQNYNMNYQPLQPQQHYQQLQQTPIYGYSPQQQQQQQPLQQQQKQSNINNIFTCDHLATFTLPTQAHIEAKDGLERLKSMEQSTGIWKMRVRLTVKTSMVRVADVNSGAMIEEFPVDVVKDLKCVQDTSAVYNNLIMFTIYDGSINELHMFQCLGRSGKEFEYEVEKARKMSLLKREPIQKPPRQEEICPIFPEDLIDPTTKKIMKNGFQTVRGDIPKDLVDPSDSVDRQVKVLDYLFSDIESFIVNLHQVAYAYHAKAKRKTVRSSGFGDGLGNMRCKQLEAKEFVDILKEFKLSFILIAKLKKIICNPNAPELVHFLFKPLSLVVNTSPDPNQSSGIELARQVINPLITPEVINLFENCLDTKENQLWNELGDGWKKTSEEWHEKLPLYVPVFKNGWSPPIDWMNEIISPSNSPFSTIKKPLQRPMHQGPPQRQMHQGPPSPKNSIYATSSSSSSGDASLTEKFLKKLFKKEAKIYVAKANYTAKNDKELSVVVGDVLEVLKDTKNWWKLKNCKGEVGFAPRTSIGPYEGGKH